MQLNHDQSQALTMMEEFIGSKDKFFLLTGGPGTGKTTTIQALMLALQKKNQRFYMAVSAPTWKAVKVIQSMMSSWEIHNVDANTIHGFLGLKLEANSEGERVLKEGKDSSIHRYEVLFIDEASMVSSALWELIQSSTKYKKTKVILIGDDAQLPPINEEISPIFSQVKLRAHLSQVMRQASENPIVETIAQVRKRIYGNEQHMIDFETKVTRNLSKGVWVQDDDKWMSNCIKAFKSPKYDEDINFVRAIAWRNKTVDKLNAMIRYALLDDANKPFMPDERVVATAPIMDSRNRDEVIINNSSEIRVLSCFPGVDNYDFDYNVWKLKVSDENNATHRIMVLDESSRDRYQQHLRHLAAIAHQTKANDDNNAIKKAWESYWKLRDRYANVNYCYALTAHRSQGSTYTNAFVAYNDILANSKPKEKWQALHVAVSRASDRLILCA